MIFFFSQARAARSVGAAVVAILFAAAPSFADISPRPPRALPQAVTAAPPKPAAAASSHAAPAPAPLAASDEAARRAKVAVKVGTRTMSVGELEDRLAEIPPFQAETFGATRDEIVKAYVEQVVVRDLLLIEGASQRKLDQELPTKHQLQRSLSTATLRATRAPFKSPSAIPMEEVTKYYEANRTRFDSPERVNLWRILCKSKDEADKVLADAKRDLTIQKFNDLARDHSIDKATAFRGGNLGFIAPDGSSNEAGVKVDPNLVKAANAVKDGELIPQPQPEGTNYAVIWRRTTVPATHRSIEEASAQIRTSLFRERTEAAEKKLIEDLRAAKLRDLNADLLKIIVLPPIDAGIGLPRSIPSATPQKK